MTRYTPDNSAVSETAWEGVMFAAVKAGLAQGIYGRRPKDMGSMTRLDPQRYVHPEYGTRYSFQHASLTFEARVQTLFGGAELRIYTWVPREDTPSTEEAVNGSMLKHRFDVIASGWFEREKGFYLCGPSGREELQARRRLRPILKLCTVCVPGFYVRRPVGCSMPWREHA